MTRATHTLEARYFERMAASLGDKMQIVENLPPVVEGFSPRVLDVGAGGGEFSHALEELGYTVVALDVSDDAIIRMRKTYPELTTVKLLANQAILLGKNSFDAVVCSSILHEVFSYGDDVRSRGHISSIERAVQSFYSILKPGGRLIIRDGVKPENWNDTAKIEMLPGHDNQVVHDYLRMCPLSNGMAYGDQGHAVALTNIQNTTWLGNLHSCMEFAYTYTWGLGSYPRETQELYTPLTLIEYDELLKSQGFELEKSFSYLQEGYPVNLAEKMLLTNMMNEEISWPDSNAIWVARKGY